MKYTINGGLPFTQKLADNLDVVYKRILLNKASLIIIDGALGEGKTTLAVEVGHYYDPDFNITEQVALGGKDFIVKLRRAVNQKTHVLVYDEAGDFDSKGALTRFNRLLNRVFEIYRQFKIIIILVLPSMFTLDNGLFTKGVPRLLVNTHRRGKTQGSFRAYSLYRMYYLRDYAKKIKVPPQAYSIVTPNFRGNFKDLPPIKRKALELLSLKGKKEVLNEAVIKYHNLVDVYNIARELNKSVAWVRLKIRTKQYKHNDIINRRKYYNTAIINQLAELET